MYCPSCEQRIESGVEHCDLCGFHLGALDRRYGNEEVAMDQVTDATHFLRTHEKDKLLEVIDAFEAQFPQLFPAFYVAELPEGTKLTEFAVWLLNRARVAVLDEFRESENGFLFVIDLTSRSMTVVPGYFAERFVSEKDLQELLRDASPYVEAGDLAQAMEKLVNDLRLILRRNYRLLLKSAKLGLVAPSESFASLSYSRASSE